jgi:hypothetical protein
MTSLYTNSLLLVMSQNEPVKWKIQLVEVSLFENEMYQYGELYEGRTKILKEIDVVVPDNKTGQKVSFEPFDESVLSRNDVYTLNKDLNEETACVEIIKEWYLEEAPDRRRCTIWRQGQDSSDIAQNLEVKNELLQNRTSFVMFWWHCLQYRTIASERLEIKDNNGSPITACEICFNHMKDIIFEPCKHCYMCSECYDTLKYHGNLCPMCRTPIDNVHTTISYALREEPFIQAIQLESNNVLKLLSNLKLFM